MTHDVITIWVQNTNTVDGSIIFLLYFFYGVSLYGKTGDSVTAVGNATHLCALPFEQVIIIQKTALFHFFKTVQAIIDTGLTINKCVTYIFGYRRLYFNMGNLAQCQIYNGTDHIKTRHPADQIVFNTAAGTGTELQNIDSVTVGDHLNQHH